MLEDYCSRQGAIMIVEEQPMTGPVSVSTMVEEILAAFSGLEERRKYMFLDWLFHHIAAVESAYDLRVSLAVWFNARSVEDRKWEYRIIGREIEWWQLLDETTLARLLVERIARSAS